MTSDFSAPRSSRTLLCISAMFLATACVGPVRREVHRNLIVAGACSLPSDSSMSLLRSSEALRSKWHVQERAW